MKKFEISEDLAQKVLNYLATRPYLEVAELITQVQQIKPIVQEEASKKLKP